MGHPAKPVAHIYEVVSSVAASSEAASSEAASGQAADAKVKAEFTVTGADGESQTFTLEVTDRCV